MMKNHDALKTIGEVSQLIQVPVYVLRFWEKKFKQISPIKKNGGVRYYSPEQVSIIERIKNLLYEKKYSINGAIGVLKKKNNCEIEKKNIIQELKHLIDEIEKNI